MNDVNQVKLPATISIFPLILAACAGSRNFDPLPANIGLQSCLHDTLTVTARHFAFEPESIPIKRATLVHLTLLSIDGSHGFALPDFGIDLRLEENARESLDVYFPEKGEYYFHCSHFCGLGHFGMTGKFVVE